jgi:hypothetical protein
LFIKTSENKEEQFPANTHSIGDSAFGLSKWLLTPYKDFGNLSNDQKWYNFIHVGSIYSTYARKTLVVEKSVNDFLDFQSRWPFYQVWQHFRTNDRRCTMYNGMNSSFTSSGLKVQEIVDRFFHHKGFPGIGAIDGSHIPIKPPTVDAEQYYYLIKCRSCNSERLSEVIKGIQRENIFYLVFHSGFFLRLVMKANKKVN